MKAIDIFNACIERISSRKDRSISFGVSTPELTAEQAAAFLQLHGCNVRMMIQPQDVTAEDLIEVATERDEPTPSQRLRRIIYAHWKNVENAGDFASFYKIRMDSISEIYKRTNLDK